ncbi:MAG: shikimate dehydrogenase [Natronospirillum sp.]
MTIKLAVLGHPIKHSRSPDIHHAFAAALGLSVQYDAIDVPPGAFNEQVQMLQDRHYIGLNVTVPHKEAAFALAHDLTARAQLAGAVNTLCFDSLTQRWKGDNTDGEGLVQDLVHRLNWPIAGRRFLVLGAGGAVRGVLGPLLAQRPGAVVIANRTVSKAEHLAEQFSALAQHTGCDLYASGFAAVEGPFDVVINGTSASLAADVPPIPATAISSNTCAYDMMYGAADTAFNGWATTAGAQQTADGLGMLVGQAAAAFALWTGHEPDPWAVLAQLRQQLAD